MYLFTHSSMRKKGTIILGLIRGSNAGPMSMDRGWGSWVTICVISYTQACHNVSVKGGLSVTDGHSTCNFSGHSCVSPTFNTYEMKRVAIWHR